MTALCLVTLLRGWKLRRGSIVKKYGYNDGKYSVKCGDKSRREYNLWFGLLRRCFDKESYPTYIGCTVSESFKHYTFFYEWCNSQTGFNTKDENGKSWELDKDLLVKGNREYHEDTCCFVPQSINKLFTKRHNQRGGYPIGVYWKKKNNQFCVQCADGSGSQKYLGLFSDYSEAFKVYKDFKEKRIKSLAEEHKDQLDPRAYEALMSYQVEETD